MDCVFCGNQIAPGQMAVKILSAFDTAQKPEGQVGLVMDDDSLLFTEHGHIGCYLGVIVKEPTASGVA